MNKGGKMPPNERRLSRFKNFKQTFLKHLRTIDLLLVSKVRHPCRKRNVFPNSMIVNLSPVFECINANHRYKATRFTC